MNRLWMLQTEAYSEKRVNRNYVRDEHQPKNWEECPWEESRFRPLLRTPNLQNGSGGGRVMTPATLEGDAWDEYMKQESARMKAEAAAEAKNKKNPAPKLQKDGEFGDNKNVMAMAPVEKLQSPHTSEEEW